MTADLRSILVRLLDAVDSAPTADDIPFPLRGLFDELRAEVLADKGRRDAVIQTERLEDSPQGKFVTRRRMRLLMSFDLFTALHTGHLTAISGDPTKTRQWCWHQTDKFFADADRPPLPPAQPAAVDLRFKDLAWHEQIFLTWLVSRGLPAGHTERPTEPAAFTDESAANARRSLLGRGLIATREDGQYYPLVSGLAVVAMRDMVGVFVSARAVEPVEAA